MKTLSLERFEAPAATALHEPKVADDGPARVEAEREAVREEARLEAEARALREHALTEALQTLAGVLLESRKGAIEAVCEDVGTIVSGVMPTLLRDDFSAEIAAAAAEIVDSAEIGKAVLKVSPEDAETIIAALRRREPAIPVEISPDNAIAPGQARISWQSGGAEWSRNDWANQLQARFGQLLKARLKQGTDG